MGGRTMRHRMAGKITITTDSGERVEAQAPVIISASRSTDIPAFYARWFVGRLRRGYVAWYNPFNRQKMYVSFKHVKAVVFWTKNPEPIIPYLKKLDERGLHYYFQFTLNDYEREGFEPNVPPLERRIGTFRRLAGMIGKERVVWRFDPVMFTNVTPPGVMLDRVRRIGEQLKGCTEKLVFSFVDVNAYKKVQNNLIRETSLFTKDNIACAEPDYVQVNRFVEGLAQLRDCWRERDGWNVTLATCAEAADLSGYGVEHNRCIDGELMKRVFAADKDLVFYLNHGRLPDKGNWLDVADVSQGLGPEAMKDKGQRKLCGCMVAKDIGMYNTCGHLCVYCYANTSRKCVMENLSKRSDEGESIVGL